MANLTKAHPLNVPGSLFVDTSCIDCGTCFHLAPQIFEETDDKSVVRSQPAGPMEWLEAKRAMVSCPTNSIGVTNAPAMFKDAQVNFPMLISDNVYYCGFTSPNSFGATSYFIERLEGNMLIDSPRFHPQLVKELELRGGVKTMFLTHRDDVADHALFAKHFGLERIIHQDEVSHDTEKVERILTITEPLELEKDILIIPTSGHTKGHLTLLYKNEYLFTGDHLFYDTTEKKLRSSRGVCWYSWTSQIESTKSLLNFNFEWVLPGHGGWGYQTQNEMKASLNDLIKEMQRKNQ